MSMDQGGAAELRPKFWERPLDSLNQAEWEALCDGCGQCCLHKLEDEDSGDIAVVAIACGQLDLDRVQCACYSTRFETVPDCIDVSGLAPDFALMPESCAYRLRSEGKPLEQWHPLISLNSASVVEAGLSVRNRVLSEQHVHPSEWEDHILYWVEL